MSCIHAPIGGQRSSGFGPVEVKWFVIIGRRWQEVRSLPAWLEVWPIEDAVGTYLMSASGGRSHRCRFAGLAGSMAS